MAQSQIKVGLAARNSSYYDPQTNTYLTLDNPRTTLTFDDVSVDDQKKLSKIAHALFAMNPALVLYEGKLPDATVATWKARYDAWGGPQAKARADKTNSGIKPVNAMSQNKQAELTLFSMDDEAAAAAAAEKAAQEAAAAEKLAQEAAEAEKLAQEAAEAEAAAKDAKEAEDAAKTAAAKTGKNK